MAVNRIPGATLLVASSGMGAARGDEAFDESGVSGPSTAVPMR